MRIGLGSLRRHQLFAGLMMRFAAALRRAVMRPRASWITAPITRLDLLGLTTAALEEDDAVVIIIGNAVATRAPIFAHGVSGLVR